MSAEDVARIREERKDWKRRRLNDAEANSRPLRSKHKKGRNGRRPRKGLMS